MEREQSTAELLNDIYRQYSHGLLEKRNFEELLFQLILDDPKYFNLYKWEKDDCLDFISWIYPRLSRAIDSYNKEGATFESYITTTIRWSVREYRSRYANRRAAEQAVWKARYPDIIYAHEDEPDYFKEHNALAPNPKDELVKNPRQLLILILKCYYCLSDDFIDRLAPRVGIEKDKLRQMVECLRKQRMQREETSRLMRENIHSQYYRCIVYENKLKTLSENSTMHLKVKSQLNKARQRLDTMRKRLAKFRLEATNLQIANILGVTKGTVDSNLYALKTRSNMMKEILSTESPQAPETPAEPDTYNP